MGDLPAPGLCGAMKLPMGVMQFGLPPLCGCVCPRAALPLPFANGLALWPCVPDCGRDWERVSFSLKPCMGVWVAMGFLELMGEEREGEEEGRDGGRRGSEEEGRDGGMSGREGERI